MKGYLLALGLLCFLGSGAYAQQIVAISSDTHTTSDDKDGDTQIRDRIVCDGQDYAKLTCCSSGNHGGDVYKEGSDHQNAMTIVTPLDLNKLKTCHYVAGIIAVGKDNWNAIHTINVTLAGGGKASFTFGEFSLKSEHSSIVERDFPISH